MEERGGARLSVGGNPSGEELGGVLVEGKKPEPLLCRCGARGGRERGREGREREREPERARESERERERAIVRQVCPSAHKKGPGDCE